MTNTRNVKVDDKKCSCKGDIHAKDKIVSCSYCKLEHHIECKGITPPQLLRMIKNKTEWFCDDKCEKSSDENNLEEPTIKDVVVMLKDVLASQKLLTDKNDSLIENLRQLTADFKKVQEENQILKARILSLESSKSTVSVCSEQDNLLANVVIAGIPNMAADLSKTVLDIASTCDENLEISADQILNVDRLFAQSEDTPASKKIAHIPVIVKFADIGTKTSFLKALKMKKDLIGEEIGLVGSRKIFASDQLTSSNFKIIRKARALRQKGAFKHAWIQNSTVLIREKEDSKIIAIRNIYELNKYDKIVDSSEGTSG